MAYGYGVRWARERPAMKKLLLGSVFLALVGSTPIMAAGNAAVRAACHEDTRRLCSSVFGDLEAVRACMREHHAELSEGCKPAIGRIHPQQGQQCLAEGERLFPSGVRASGKMAWQY